MHTAFSQCFLFPDFLKVRSAMRRYSKHFNIYKWNYFVNIAYMKSLIRYYMVLDKGQIKWYEINRTGTAV